MLLDSTALLNRRHVDTARRDDQWKFRYPHPEPGGGADEAADACGDAVYHPDDVMLYLHGAPPAEARTITTVDAAGSGTPSARVAVATYGNGVPKALEAVATSGVACDVIDCPLLSRCPEALPPLLRSSGYEALLLVDPCREGAGPLPNIAAQLQAAEALPARWRLLTAPHTYNPLGRTLTFVSAAAIGEAVADLAREL